MNKLGMLVAGSLAAGCVDDSKTIETGSTDECDLVPYVSTCSTDPCPAIAHADPLVDLRTAIVAEVYNAGTASCPPASAELQLDGVTQTVEMTPELASREWVRVFNTENVFTQADTSVPAGEHETRLILDGVEESVGTFEPRTGVGCIVKGHLLEYVHEDQGVSVAACVEKPFGDVNVYNPYCGDIKRASEEGIVTGEVDTRDIDSDEDTSELVYDTWTCANRAVAATVLFRAYGLEETTDLVCPDVDPSAWYAPYMNAVQAATGVLANEDGLCDPEGDLIRPDLEPLLENLDLL